MSEQVKRYAIPGLDFLFSPEEIDLDRVDLVLASDYDAAIARAEALREKADKYATIERVMEMLQCDEREGGVWTACSLVLISSAHKMNSTLSTVEPKGVTFEGEQLGDWRVTVERINAAVAAKADN